MAKRIPRNLRRPPALSAIDSDQVRSVSRDGRTLYSVADVLRLVSDRPRELWDQLRHREPSLESLTEPAHFADPPGPHEEEALLATTLDGLLRIMQSVSGARAELVKRWLAATAAESIEEANDPELAVQRARRSYEALGYPRPWIDQRLRAISARAQVAGEWYKRGAQSSDDFRALTNILMFEAFGMDAEIFRQHKGLFGRENLRDHMTDLELALVSLGETIAASLHRSHGSKTLGELEADMQIAGRIAGDTRMRIEQAGGRAVIEGERKSWSERRNPAEPPATSEADSGRQVIFRRETPNP